MTIEDMAVSSLIKEYDLAADVGEYKLVARYHPPDSWYPDGYCIAHYSVTKYQNKKWMESKDFDTPEELCDYMSQQCDLRLWYVDGPNTEV